MTNLRFNSCSVLKSNPVFFVVAAVRFCNIACGIFATQVATVVPMRHTYSGTHARQMRGKRKGQWSAIIRCGRCELDHMHFFLWGMQKYWRCFICFSVWIGLKLDICTLVPVLWLRVDDIKFISLKGTFTSYISSTLSSDFSSTQNWK